MGRAFRNVWYMVFSSLVERTAAPTGTGAPRLGESEGPRGAVLGFDQK